MRWRCSAGAGAWSWTPVAYPGVWLVVAVIGVAYWRLSRGAGTPAGARWAGWLGVAALDVALDWPVGSLAAGYLASAHALQFLLVVLIAPPLLLIGVRHGLERRWPRDPSRARLLRAVLNPLLGAIAFNVIIVATHVPWVNDTLMPSQAGAFAIDLAWLTAGLWFWWPLIVPVPARPLFAVPLRMLYFFLGTMVHTGIGILLLVADHPMYGVYELAPRATALSAMTDLNVAGGIMELGGGGLIFGVLTVMFFRWTGGMGAERDHASR